MNSGELYNPYTKEESNKEQREKCDLTFEVLPTISEDKKQDKDVKTVSIFIYLV